MGRYYFSMALTEIESDEETSGDSRQWGIVARPNLNTGALIGQSTVHQSKFPVTTPGSFEPIFCSRGAYYCN